MGLDFFKRFIGQRKLRPGQQTIVRTIEDVKIAVTEGLSGTTEIQVQAWTPDIAKELFFEIRDRLKEDRK